MTKKQVVDILKGMKMNCEIAQVQISFVKDGNDHYENVLVYLVSDPSNDDQIINANHWWIFSNITEFKREIKKVTSDMINFISVTEFTSDFGE